MEMKKTEPEPKVKDVQSYALAAIVADLKKRLEQVEKDIRELKGNQGG
jgi:hypothetical protein